MVKGVYLNCQSYRDRGLCKALLAESLSHAWDFARGRVAFPICKLTRCYTRYGIRELRLVCDVPCISARQEILWSYGVSRAQFASPEAQYLDTPAGA